MAMHDIGRLVISPKSHPIMKPVRCSSFAFIRPAGGAVNKPATRLKRASMATTDINGDFRRLHTPQTVHEMSVSACKVRFRVKVKVGSTEEL